MWIVVSVSVVVVIGAAYVVFGRGSFGGGVSSGIDKTSLMGMMKEKGETVMSKSEFIAKCKESDADTQDMCYGMGAFYYKDAGFCGYLKNTETKGKCNKESIDSWYTMMQVGGGTPFGAFGTGVTIPGGGFVPGTGIPSDNGDVTEPPPSDGGTVTEQPTDYYGIAKEISAPGALTSEIKSILNDACGSVKLTAVYNDFAGPGNNMYVYVWKNKPTAEKLESAFVKKGYTVESSGEALILKKDKLMIAVSWAEEIERQEIGINTIIEE